MIASPRFGRRTAAGLACLLGGILVLGPDRAWAGPVVDQGDPAGLARALTADGPRWAAGPHGYGGPGDGSWRYATLGEPGWADYAAEFDLTLVRPADRKDGLELGAFTNYRALANLGGYEAAAVVRYESADRHYRIAVSTLWKEIIVWRPTGGVVRVQPFPFAVGKTYRLRVTCRGPRLAVHVDGQAVLDWWDRADPVLKGRVGVGRKEGEAYLTRLRVEPLPPETAAAPPHEPSFREQDWHGERWFFDGQEPVFVLTRSNVLDHMRFLPGYRPGLYAFNYVTDWSQFQPTRLTASKVMETGRRLVLETSAVDPARKNSITSDARLVLTYDQARGMYHYDHACTTRIDSLADAEKVSTAWDHGDAVFLGCVGSAQTRDPKAYRPLHRWAVFQAPDGKPYKVPLNPNFHYLGRSSTNGGPLKPAGGYVLAVGDPVVSPVIRIPELPRDATDIKAGLCWWAFDVHTIFTPKTRDGKVAPGAYTTRVVYTGMRAAESQRLFDQAGFYEPLDLTPEVPVFTAGVGHPEPFDKAVRLASPHTEHRLWAGTLDRTVGRGDRSSLRVDGPAEAWALTGPSYFTAPFGKKNVVTAWVKTKDVGGEGPALGFRRLDDNRAEYHCTGLTGTRDWTQVRYVTAFPADVFGAHVLFRASGPGTVWFDDVKVEPLDEKAATDAPPVRPYPINPADPDVVLHWDGRGTPTSLVDASGYGHHGKIYGTAAWAEEGGKRALVLDGKTTYVWPLCSPALTLGPPCTVAMEIRPEAGGTLIGWGFQFTYRLVGGPDRFAVEYHPSGGKAVTSRPFLAAGAWQHLALVLREDRLALYCDGRLIEELAVRPPAGIWSLHLQSTWHRHLSFFGVGPGDMSLVREDSGYHWKGRLRAIRVVRRALTEAQIRALAALQ